MPPRGDVIDRLCRALRATDSERHRLTIHAAKERSSCGVRVGRSIPPHVAELIRELILRAPALTPRSIEEVRSTLKELEMS